jgi:hypothetical protein
MSSAAKVIAAMLHEGMSWAKFLKKMPLGKQGALWALSRVQPLTDHARYG